MDQQQRKTLVKLFDYMQRNDPNGDYHSYLTDIDNGKMTVNEVVTAVFPVLQQWRRDLGDWNDPTQKTLVKFQNSLISILR
jgi:hypothetical protein